jgi:C-terminal domain of 1-Cys peroxiredoxin
MKSWGPFFISFEQISSLLREKIYPYMLCEQTLQYLQENSDEVCPARWKPGDKFMKSIRNSARSQILQVGLGTRSRSSVMVLIIFVRVVRHNFCWLVFASFHLMLVSLIQMLTFNNLPRK